MEKMERIERLQKKKIPVLILVGVLVAVAIFYWLGGNRYTGLVEATMLSHVAEVPGKILEMPVELGQPVKAGDVLAVVDSKEQQHAYDQLLLTLEKRKLGLAQEQGGTGVRTQAETNLAVTEANYNSALSASQKAGQDYRDAQTLYQQGAISKDVLEQAKVRADAASSALTSARALWENAKSGDTTSGTKIDIQLLEIQVEDMEELLDKFTIRAAKDGVVMSKSYQAGDVVSPGFNLVDLAIEEGKVVVLYLPIDRVHDLEYGQSLVVKANQREYQGTVKYIDVESVYTPKDMQTMANKNKKSIKVKLGLPEDCDLKPGEEVKVGLK